MRQWRAALCLLAALAASSCATNPAPARDLILAATEDELDNMLGRLLTEHETRPASSQRTRRESEGESASDSSQDSDAWTSVATSHAGSLSGLAGFARWTVDRLRERLHGPPASAGPALVLDGAVSLPDLASLRNSGDPIVAGPWLSEVGFELLYWIPFLRWVASEYDLPPERIIAVSRGGAGVWYDDVASRFVDVFHHVTPADYRASRDAHAREAGHQKQYEVTPFDKTLIDRIKAHLDLGENARVLHPSVMYQLLRRYWNEKAPAGVLTGHTRYSPLPDPGDPDSGLALPERFVAVRFYFRPSFPDTPDNRQFAGDVIRRLAQRHSVVLLNTGFEIDDHEDLDLDGPGVFRVDSRMTPVNNLTLQSRIISRADAFVGTYGGLSYLGPYYGIPTTTFYSEPDELVTAHVDATWRLSRAMKSSLAMLNVSDAPLVASSLDGFGD